MSSTNHSAMQSIIKIQFPTHHSLCRYNPQDSTYSAATPYLLRFERSPVEGFVAEPAALASASHHSCKTWPRYVSYRCQIPLNSLILLNCKLCFDCGTWVRHVCIFFRHISPTYWLLEDTGVFPVRRRRRRGGLCSLKLHCS